MFSDRLLGFHSGRTFLAWECSPGLDAHFRWRVGRAAVAPRMHPACDEARTCARGSWQAGPMQRKWESTMKFMLTFSLKPDTKARDEAIGRFKATGGRSPKGAKLLGRWTAADFSG